MKKKYLLIYFLIIMLFLFFNINNVLAQNFSNSNSKYETLGATYSFYLGNQYLISKAIKTYPEHEEKLLEIRNRFNYNFQDSIENIKKDLLLVLNKNELEDLENQIFQSFDNTVPNFNQININALINNLNDFSKGNNISPEILKTILNYKPLYTKFPEQEMLDNFIQEYSTKNNKKANGLNLKFKLPFSWRGFEGERPHIVQKYISNNGNGLEMFQIYITENKDNIDINEFISKNTKKQIIELFNNEYNNSSIRFTFKDVENLYIDNIPFLKLRYESQTNSGQLSQITNSTTHIEGLIYFTFYKDSNIMIFFSTTSNDQVAKLKSNPNYKIDNRVNRFNKYKDLFSIIANSMVLYNQW